MIKPVRQDVIFHYSKWRRIDRRNSFDQPVNNNLITYDIIRKIVTGQEDDYTIGCLLGYNYFINCYKMIAIDLSKQSNQIDFTKNLDRERNTTMFFIINEAKETILGLI